MSLMDAPEEETEPFPTEIYETARPEVWVNGISGKAKNAWPIQIPLKKKCWDTYFKAIHSETRGPKGNTANSEGISENRTDENRTD